MLFVTVISLGLLAIVHGQCALKTIAFSAALSQDKQVPANGVVIYDNVITNHGNAYDSSNGIFTAPVGGIYSFEVHVLSVSGGEAWLEIALNDQLKVSVFAKQNSTYDSSSNSVILKMKEGDLVKVRAHSPSALYGRPAELYTTLTGQLLSGM